MKKKNGKSPNTLMAFAAYCKGKYIFSVIIAILGVACGMIPYYAVSRLIIGLVEGISELSYYLTWCGIAAVGFFGKTLFHHISTTFSHLATFAVISEIRCRLTKKLERTPLGYVLDTPSGKFKDIMVEKADSIEPTLAHVLPELTSNLLIPLLIIGYLFAIDWRMALISLATLPVGAVLFMVMMTDYKPRFKNFLDAQKHVNAVSVEYINGIEVIKAFNQSATSYEKFAKAVKGSAVAAIDWMKSVQYSYAFTIGILPAVLIGVLPVGCLFVMNGTLSVPDFITIMILSLGIVGPLMASMNLIDQLAKINSIFGEISAILDEPEMKRPETQVTLNGIDIDLQDVSFAYRDTPVLNHINLKIPSGKVTALVGPSGSGKSTIAKLIASLWDVTGGAIYIGGKDTRDIPMEQLMETVSYVSQDNYLFNDTIRNNIRMGNPESTDEEVEKAAKASGCHDFIMALQDGYDTTAGSAGSHLSGGERQRITIARAMLKNAPIVILDEATAYTDPENEAVIQRAVSGLVKEKTLIVIAHRLSTIINADKIVVVKDGNIHNQGRHDELLCHCDLYQSMWKAHMEMKEQEMEGELKC